MKKIVRLTESDMVRLVQRIIKEQTAVAKKISGNPTQLLMNISKEPNPALGVSVVPQCYEYYRKNSSLYGYNYGPSSNEIEDYMDYLGVYGKVPLTGIPIPYQSSDLQFMLQMLQGTGVYGNYTELPDISRRTTEYNGKIYPTVDIIRADFNKLSRSGSLWGKLKKRLTDSQEDWTKKQEIISELESAYKNWIDCVNGVITEV